MIWYLATRALHAVAIVWGAFTLSFVMLYLLPGNPVEIMLGGQGGTGFASAAQVAQLSAEYGFDKPAPVQYLDRLVDALHGDFGTSVQTGATVTHTFLAALPQTFELAGAGLLLAALGGPALALLATMTRSARLGRLMLSLPAVGVSLPQFAVGLLLLELFSFRLRLLPAFGDPAGAGLILPAITLALPNAALFAQVFAQSLDTESRQPYITIARAKGASPMRVHLGHAARNAALPLVSLLGVVGGNLLAGTVIVETVFSRDGFGRITTAAVESKDIPVVQGAVVVGALIFAAVNLAADVAAPLLDPRLRLPAPGRAGA